MLVIFKYPPVAIDACITGYAADVFIALTTPVRLLLGYTGTCIVTAVPVPGSIEKVLLVRYDIVTLNVALVPLPPVTPTGFVGF